MSSGRPRVALVLASSTGGVGRHVRSLTEQLVKSGHRVDVYGPAATEELFGFRAVGAGFAPLEIPARPHPLRDATAVATLRRRVRADRPDVVHAHGLRAGLVAAAAGRRPLVVTWHNMLMPTQARNPVLRGLERVVARSADLTLTASDDLIARVLRLGGRDVRPGPVAAPTLDPPTKTRDQVRAELGVDGPLVLTVGRLHPQKRLDVLIDASAGWAPATVVIAGSGPEENALRTRAAEHNAPVRFLGHRTDVAELLAACDVAVVTSDWEARQLFAQETLRAGRPLVATAVGGVPGLVGDGARLVPPGDPKAVGAAVRALLDDPDAAATLAARGAEVAASWPDEATVAAHAAAVYAELRGVPSASGAPS
ncbi:glycosyltransferase family 4 protein [Cryptosporangium aurantiacum]|uniref:Glycosyltransferase involved in cell wall bisynthesis n=1 Tax=Cryptosporangium aurantiacum TaxID=134849 RepID=A0A1M7RNE5_9ACTN|nr:glycosyltransferase family 4 protein [Cryptosporangium aurantiacum]SHN47857.1 Glycosyltransferase involved in cell wall bisynthesis [Cryptosporangium aurantiacum]